MPELPDLDPIPDGNVSDDDLLLVYDLQNERAYKISRGALLGNVARQNENATFADLSAEEITATQITPALLLFAAGGGIADMVTATVEVTIPSIAAGASVAVPLVVEGAAAGSMPLVTISEGVAAGLLYVGHIGAVDQVTITFTNASSGTIAGATKTAQIALILLP